MPTSRTLRQALNLATAAAFATALAIPALTHDAALGGWTGLDANTEAIPVNIPKWDAAYASEFPGCSARKATTPGDVVVVDQWAEAHRVDFAAAWNAVRNDERADDVWVVGWCA